MARYGLNQLRKGSSFKLVEGNKEPRFAVWGGQMNLRRQVEPLVNYALGFLTQRLAHHAVLQFTFI